MAYRDTTNFREVINVVAEQPNQMMNVVGEVGSAIITQGQEARINENMSKAQLELSALQDKYQIDFQSNPMGGMEEYKQQRQAIFDKYGDEISPLFRRTWNDSTRQLAIRNDATQQGWALKQTRQNTVRAINNSMKNNFMQATLDGQKFGESDETEVDAYVNFGTSKNQLSGWATKNLGAETSASMLEGYDDDYMKSFLSGVSETNPVKALRLMEEDAVKNSFTDALQYQKMKKSIESRALNASKISSDRAILNAMRDENSLLGASFEKPLGYAELQAEFERLQLPDAAQNFFLQANGFEKLPKTGELDQEAKIELKQSIFSRIINLGKGDKEITPDDIKSLQSDIYTASAKKAITPTETSKWLANILDPYIAQKEETLTKYSDNGWFAPDLGLKTLQDEFDKNIAITPAEGEELGNLAKRENGRNRIRLYDNYMEYLGREAQSRNIPIADISKLDRPTQRAIYAKAQKEAISAYNAENYPELAGMKEVPNAVIPVITNPSDLQPTYKGKGGKKDITADQIMETARNRGMSPSKVVELLRQNGVIE